MQISAALATLAGLLLLVGCGTAGGPPPPPAVTVTVSPASATVKLGQQLQFTATVTGTSNTSVTWQVNNVTGGNATNGSITAQGLYTAPASPPPNSAVTIRATSQADSTATGSASVTLTTGIQVSIAPPAASLPVGASQIFTALVLAPSGQSTAVTWSLTGPSCPANCGSLALSRNTATYTAPAAVPSPATVSVVATSQADPSQLATAMVTIVAASCSPAVSVSPSAATLALGAQQTFTASVCSSASQSVTWSIVTPGCSISNCGSVVSTGPDTALYTAPASPPPSNPLTLVATNSANPAQSASASITISSTCPLPISISPSAASLGLGQQQSFTASVCFTSNQSVAWSLSGSGCTATNCGAVSSTGANTSTYTAPSVLPPSNPLTLSAVSVADPTKSASALITISSGVGVAIQPETVEVATVHRVSFTASVRGSTTQTVNWFVNGAANGNSTVGQICVAGSNPCAAPAGPVSGAIDYLAPSSVPSPDTVSITAVSAADASASGAASATILPHLVVSIWPANSVVAPSGTVEFAATITGSSNAAVAWKVACAASSCSSITAAGVFTAPAAAPSPNSIAITATSQDDSTRSASATVALTSAVALAAIAPASVTAGAAAAFPLVLTGYSFVPSSPGPGTTLLVSGTPRATTCASATECSIAIQPGDVATTGSLSLQAQNPDGSRSNTVSLVIAPPDPPADVISLSSSAPVAGGKDMLAVEPTTAGAASSTSPMAVLFLGVVDASGVCNVNFAPIALARPPSGVATFTICAGGNGLDSSEQVLVAGSQSTAVAVSAIASFDGSLVQMTLTISSTAAPGLRSLVFIDGDQNRAVASGAIDVE